MSPKMSKHSLALVAKRSSLPVEQCSQPSYTVPFNTAPHVFLPPAGWKTCQGARGEPHLPFSMWS